MEYRFKSDLKTVYLEMPYKLVIASSSGIALSNGKTTLTASVVDVNSGDEIQISADSFKWTRREQSDGFTEVTGKTIEVESSDLVSGSATFICSCRPTAFYWADTAMITLSASVRGENGWSTTTLQLYKRASSEPAAFDGGVVTYHFATGVISGDLGTWSKTVPSGADPLYIIYGSAFSQTDSDTIQPNEWTAPALASALGVEGEKGSTVATVIIFQRAENKPAVPSDVVTYSFKTGQFTGLGLWSSAIPDGTLPCWATTATAVSKTDSDTIQPSEWADPKKVFAVGENGQSAPYQRQIFKASVDKPATPTGTAESIPEGWSLQIPQRTSEELIWVSSAYVVYNGTTPIYSEWSEPTQYSGKDGTVAIVEWQWGKSSKYPPDVANYTFIYNNSIVAFDNAVFVGNASSWTRGDIPDQPDGYDYLWKREYDYESGQWNVYLANGPAGLKGNYKGLGYIVIGTNSIVFAGVDNKGDPSLDLIELFLGGTKYNIAAASFTLTGISETLYLVCPIVDSLVQSLRVVYPKVTSDGSVNTLQWVDINTGESFTEAYLLAEIAMNGDTIDSVTIIEPRTLKAYSKTYFMSLMNSGNMEDINAFAEALGIERVFTRVAALESFIHALFVNDIELTLDEIRNIIGAFHSTGYKKGDYQNGNKPGFFMDATGYIELWSAILRDVTIISKTSSNQIIFSVTPKYDGGDFSHTETSTRKYLGDLIPKNPTSGTCTVYGTAYNYEWTSTDYLWMLSKTVGTNTFTTTAPYDCKIQLGINVTLNWNTTSFDWYVNNIKKGSLSASGLVSMPRKQIELRKNDVLKIVGTGGTGLGIVLPVEYPSIWGGIENPSINARFVITKKIGDVTWPFAQRINSISLVGNENNLWFPASQTTGLVYDGKSFDDYDWYLDEDDTSTIVSSINEVFDVGIIYNTDSSKSNTIVYKGKTYSITNFIINEGSVSFTTSSNETITVTEGNFAVSANLHVLDGAGAVELMNMIPSSNESDIGNGSKPFRNIHGKNLYADTVTTGKLNLSQGSFVIYRNDKYFTLWSDGFAEVHDYIEMSDDLDEVFTYPAQNNIAIEFATSPYVVSNVQDRYDDSLSGTSNIPNYAIQALYTTYHVYNDFGEGSVQAVFKGMLTSTCFSQLKSALGV